VRCLLQVAHAAPNETRDCDPAGDADQHDELERASRKECRKQQDREQARKREREIDAAPSMAPMATESAAPPRPMPSVARALGGRPGRVARSAR